MHRPSYTARLARAVSLWLFGTWAGRKWLAAIAAVTVGVVGLTGNSVTKEHKGTWSGFENHYAPNKGSFTVVGDPSGSATCTVRGKTGWAIGNGWNFKGDATVAETSCDGRIAKDGGLSLDLDIRLEWSGRVKGIGGDWEDVDGYGDCKGKLTGTLGKGGKWEGKCKNAKYEWGATFDWKPEAD